MKNLELDELWEVLYALEDKAYYLEDHIIENMTETEKAEKVKYLKSISSKVESVINNWEA